MTRNLLIIIILFYSNTAFADWREITSGTSQKHIENVGDSPCTYPAPSVSQVSYQVLLSLGYDFPHYIVVTDSRTDCSSSNNGTVSTIIDYYVNFWFNTGDGAPVIPPSDHTVYNYIYTDEQCQAQYGTSSVPAASDGGMPDSFDTGACLLTPKAGVGACFPKTGQCNGDFTATSTGNTNTPGQTGASAPEIPDYLTETDDPDTCSAGSVSYGGTSYCVDQSAIDDGSISIIGGDGSGGDSGSDSGGIDWGDTPSDSTPGTSTGSDGDPLGMGGVDSDGDGEPDSSGNGEGDSTLGDVVAAINGLKATVRNGFDGIVDKFTKGVEEFSKGPSQSAIDSEFGSEEELEAKALAEIEAIKGELIDRIDGGDSELQGLYDSMGDYFGQYFPMVPSPGCEPLVFASGQPYEFTIECEIFDLIRSALAWILGVFTIYVVISTMFSARPH